ncbi:MAG TPA: hypothetical protein VKA84_01380 [Gemmatimonadaceae bacterium]|nr:hypothetical protein [Gemmatimonadaceae bacterium]
MTRRSALVALVAALAAVPAAAAVAYAGPPYVSIELPANPFDRASRGAFLLVHAFHHGEEMAFPVAGTAEGIVDGQRRTVQLQFEKTSRQGVYALRKQWADEGTWTLVISVTQGPSAGNTATALVEIGENGMVAVRVPTQRNREGWDIPKQVTSAEVDAALRARVAKLAVAKGK